MGYGFVLPATFFLAVFVIFPVLFNIYMSFHRWDIMTPPVFRGLRNYEFLFADPTFWQSVGNTILFVALAVPAQMILGLIAAILLAPVDLLWFGGIGTYVKASSEDHARVGDRANDAIRIDGADLKAKVIGEGANLGLTQLGRVEYARAGGRLNTDAIDNSAGVNTSDYEVNIKIALASAVASGRLGGEAQLSCGVDVEIGGDLHDIDIELLRHAPLDMPAEQFGQAESCKRQSRKNARGCQQQQPEPDRAECVHASLKA